MVKEDLRNRDIDDKAVLGAMLEVPRHLFVDEQYKDSAYADHPIPIKEHQTISQPYIVALMTQSARLKPTDRVLEVGTGSGYQAAVLSKIVKEVFTVEIVKPLAHEAEERLRRLGYTNVHVKQDDGYKGWDEHAPYDAIIITAAAPKVPEPLISQLKTGGTLVMPLGENWFAQDLVRITKQANGLKEEYIAGVRFVPMMGEVRK